VGEILGRTYRIVELLDEGGMGRIYVAEHLRLHREVAVKVLVRHAQDDKALQRFYREAALISRLQHPHIVNVLDFDTTDRGEPYLVMERLEGETLEERLEALGPGVPLDLDEAATIATEVASALTAAHQADIIHRDLKPANIFLSRVGGHRDVAKLLDFGIGKQLARAPGQRKLTGEFDLLGTPNYMAPEQALGDNARVDQRTDQYALAAIAFEMITGRRPFEGDKLHELLRAIVYDEVPRVSHVSPRPLPAALDRVFARGLARDPEDRFATANAFAAALEAVAQAASAISSRPTDPAPPMSEGAADEPPPPASSDPSLASRRTSQVRQRDTLPSREEEAPISRSDPRALIALAERAKQSLDHGELEEARRRADEALTLIDEGDDPAARSMRSLTSSLFEQIYEAYLGGGQALLQLVRAPSSSDRLSPGEAFLLSRIDRGLVVADVVTLSTSDRLVTLRALTKLLDAGILRPGVAKETSSG